MFGIIFEISIGNNLEIIIEIKTVFNSYFCKPLCKLSFSLNKHIPSQERKTIHQAVIMTKFPTHSEYTKKTSLLR